MTATAIPNRTAKATEYLELLRSMAAEMERAMRAIAQNALPELEDSVASQQTMSGQLVYLAGELAPPAYAANPAGDPASRRDPESAIDDHLARQVREATASLSLINKRYAALLEHSRRSVALMISLYSSYQGNFSPGQFGQGQNSQGKIKEASSTRSKQQTWSCRM